MRDEPTHPEPSPRPGQVSPNGARSAQTLGPIDPRQRESTDTEWLAPDPPPIPDRIRKKVEPRRASLPPIPPIPKVQVKVDHRWVRYGFIGGGAIVLGMILALLLRPSPFDESARAQWQGLCQDYARWFSPLNQAIEYEDEQVLRDFGLTSVVDILVNAEQFDPRVIADRPGSNVAAIGQEPPATARTRDAIRATEQAAAALARIETAFAQWPTAVALESHHVMFVDHGWDRAAEFVELTLKQAPPYGKAPVGASLIAMHRLEAQTTGIASAIERLEDELAVLDAHDDPVFKALAQAVRDLDHQAPVARQPQLLGDDPYTVQLVGLAETLGPLEAFAHRFRQLVESDRWSAVDQARFREQGRAYAMLAEGDHPHSDIFRTWLEEVDTYRGIKEDDWRPAWADEQRLALEPAKASLRTLEAAGHLTAKPLANRIDQLHARIDALLELPLDAGHASEIEIQRHVLEREVRDLATSAHRLDQEVTTQQTIQALREEAPLIEDATQQSPAVEAAWRAERQRIAQRLERHGDLERAADELQTARWALLRLNDPAMDAGLAHAPTVDTRRLGPAAKAWTEALQSHAARQREATLERGLAKSLSLDESRWSALRQQYTERLASVEAGLDFAQRTQRALDGAYRLNDTAVSTADGGLAAEAEAWKPSALLQDPAVNEAATLLLNRVESLAQWQQVQRWDVLTQTVRESDDAATAFTAWRRLGEIDWPEEAWRGLTDELASQKRLAKLIAAMQNDDSRRATQLAAELKSARPERWLSAMQTASTDEDLAAIAGLAEPMNVDVESLPAAVRFNLALHRTRSALASLSTAPGPQRDAEVLAIAEAFAEQVRPLADTPGVEILLDTLDSLTAPDAPDRQVLAEAGPAQRGWDAAVHDDGRAVTFTREGWALTFVRVDPERGPPFYLATTELPVGLALEAAAWERASAELLAVMPSRGDEDIRKGPRTWVYGTNALELNPQDWLGASPTYLRDLTPSPPKSAHPINYVTAEGAAYLAAQLGCRLPTVAQWTAAMQRFPVPPRTLPNLRDTTWAGHAQYAAQLIRAGTPGVDWANSDVFRPVALDAQVSADPVGDFHPINDATLWFTPTPRHDDGSAAPVDLVGNVAELVTLLPVETEALLDDALPIVPRREAFRQQHKESFAVIGGSALSPASLNPTAPQPLNLFSGARGYADVGVRLVFEVPSVSPARQAAAALRQQPFLRP